MWRGVEAATLKTRVPCCMFSMNFVPKIQYLGYIIAVTMLTIYRMSGISVSRTNEPI
jgi:hypothetical protein